MEDILIILLGLVWIIYSFYKKDKRNKQQQASQQSTQKSSESDMVSMLEQFMGEEKKMDMPKEEQTMSYQTIEESERTIPMEENISSWQQSQPAVETLEKTEYTDAKNNIATILKQKEFEEDEAEIVQHIDKTEVELFDLRKAVIYSAILHRPHAM